MTKNIAVVSQQIVDACVSFSKNGLVEGPWGNISARVDDNTIAITPSGRSYESLTKEDIAILRLDGSVVKSLHNPSSEAFLHLAIYKNRSDIKAVVHTHSMYASAYSVAEKPILPVVEDVAQIVGGQVDVAQYALPGTEQLATNAVIALGNKSAVLLSKHGVVACGRTLSEALTVANIVEKTAKIYFLANQINNNLAPLSKEDVAYLRKGYVEKYSKQQLVED